jgi:hypothetical protein
MAQSKGEVIVFVVQKNTWIEPSNAFKSAAPNKESGARQNGDFAVLGGPAPRHLVRFGKQVAIAFEQLRALWRRDLGVEGPRVGIGVGRFQ